MRLRDVGRGSDFGCDAVCIGERAAFFFRRFEPAGDAKTEEAVFVVVEDHMIERFKGDDQVDAAR